MEQTWTLSLPLPKPSQMEWKEAMENRRKLIGRIKEHDAYQREYRSHGEAVRAAQVIGKAFNAPISVIDTLNLAPR